MRVLLFGPLRDLAGWREQTWDVAPADLAAVKAELARTNPRLGDALARPGVQVAVDKVVVRENTILHAAAEVAFLAPMSGG